MCVLCFTSLSPRFISPVTIISYISHSKIYFVLSSSCNTNVSQKLFKEICVSQRVYVGKKQSVCKKWGKMRYGLGTLEFYGGHPEL